MLYQKLSSKHLSKRSDTNIWLIQIEIRNTGLYLQGPQYVSHNFSELVLRHSVAKLFSYIPKIFGVKFSEYHKSHVHWVKMAQRTLQCFCSLCLPYIYPSYLLVFSLIHITNHHSRYQISNLFTLAHCTIRKKSFTAIFLNFSFLPSLFLILNKKNS